MDLYFYLNLAKVTLLTKTGNNLKNVYQVI